MTTALPYYRLSSGMIPLQTRTVERDIEARGRRLFDKARRLA